mmetsp:Transcript_31314/g.30154  ORF Transcript_31314/g.30154 Transcript_31314/m.30154 type:complete len:90 (+) Transcript_31314:134-403(+)|eukprot:CAMPEP_0197841684 /NCGR_PEP_ID=MMETSP1437-20131217/46319_1 /TAXON_ID=49252 ORGANISM="Eucampia antarctica, Strain CCMP1452" /NCGR_SAMPLE_ID=MMETSP1437 /ASSEMBLY_ACC=CAM_ASM_001096 /LENGTH=89 /DNA_ID=CAMNT_0043451475 /DNA_START=134 /DNA_END=403 /DNA_ORIENTATION=+
MIAIHVLFFASARELAENTSQLDVQLDEEGATTAKLREYLAQRFPHLKPLVLDEESVTLALNEEYVPSGQVLPLSDGDTVALIPPISGG